MNAHNCISDDVRLGKNVRLSKFINLYGCEIGDESMIEDEVFIGHGVVFINDRYPRAANAEGSLQTEADWTVEPTIIKKGASIGSGATILSNTIVGENAIVGAGSVVTNDVPPNAVVVGNPARILRYIK